MFNFRSTSIITIKLSQLKSTITITTTTVTIFTSFHTKIQGQQKQLGSQIAHKHYPHYPIISPHCQTLAISLASHLISRN